MTYEYDIKLYLHIHVEAPTQQKARRIASHFMGAIEPTSDFVAGFNGGADPGTSITSFSLAAEDGEPLEPITL